MLQHFPEYDFTPVFRSETPPRLYYMGKIIPEISAYPRILHSHSSHVEISVIYRGESEYLINEQRQTIKAGDILIYNSNVAHDELSSQELQVGSYFFAIGNLSITGLRPNALIPDDIVPVFRAGADFDRITALCERMLADIDREDEWSTIITGFSTMALLEIIWRVIHKSAPVTEPDSEFFLGQRIKNYVDQHYKEDVSLRSVSDALHLSESYVSHTFKDMMGYSPMQYVTRRRIGEAQTLLIATDLTISEIAGIVGYDSQSHFNQRFSQYVSISPGQFRKNYKDKKIDS